MRKLASLALILGIACTTAPTGPVTTTTPPPAGPYGMTVEEEARILALEDRREYDPAVVAEWVKHPNLIHRRRIALALGRIGPHTFIDTNNNGVLDLPAERRAGVNDLIALRQDPDPVVRQTVAFSLGEIGDVAGAETLYTLTTDADASVGGEAIEALSKINWDSNASRDLERRYYWMTDARWPEGLRARAIRFLFRFETDEAFTAATTALASPSPAIRQEAAYALARRATPTARGQLELLLTDPNPLTRAYSATALGRIGDAISVPPLVVALGDVHPWVRTNAAIALSRIYEKAPAAANRPDDLPRVLATFEDPDPGVRSSMIDLVGYYARTDENTRTALLNVLENGTRAERELAVGAVMKHLGAAGFGGLKYEVTPWTIVRLLEGSDSAKHRRQYRTHPEAVVRTAVLSSIPEGRANPERETIQMLLRDPDVIVRANAIEQYAKTTHDELQVMITTLQEAEQRERAAPMNDARLAAITALAGKYWPRRPLFLRELLTDQDPVVRRVAADLIVEKLGEKRPQYTPLPINRPQAEYEEIVRWARTPHTATIHMPRGKIELALLPQEATMTAWNFAQLARKKFFDNTSFMRVVPNFVIQGGDPRNDMNGGPGYAIRDEINLQKYTRGAVGMALSGPDTGGSQFFVTHSQQPHLDGGYTIFARVYDGMSSVVDQVERGDLVTTITIDERPAATQEQVSSVSNVSLPLVVGTLTQEQIVAAVPSYGATRDQYQPDATVVEMMKSYVRPGDRVEVYMGTWCGDSEREVPKFLRIANDLRAQFGVELPVTFVAVDRSKQQPAKLLAGKSVDKIATFIYYRNDEELGRIAEKPVGVFEDDLLAIVAKER